MPIDGKYSSMPKIPEILVRVCWLLFSTDPAKTDKDGRQLLTIAGLLLLIIAALTHTTG